MRVPVEHVLLFIYLLLFSLAAVACMSYHAVLCCAANGKEGKLYGLDVSRWMLWYNGRGRGVQAE